MLGNQLNLYKEEIYRNSKKKKRKKYISIKITYIHRDLWR